MPQEDHASSDDRADLRLFVPAEYASQIHRAAMRLDVGDSAVLTAAWLGARGTFASSPVEPKLGVGESQPVYFYVSKQVQDEVAAVAVAGDRSKSWVYLKAWEMTRGEIDAFEDQATFHAWVKKNRDRAPAKPAAP